MHHRSDLMKVQRELAAVPGLTVMIYDQTCASEKRRRRKRGLFPDPDRRIVINEQVCEGCGDCGRKSNCVAIAAVETEFGRKRQIDQSACNKDYSCVEGFCPSFVTVHGGKMKKGEGVSGAQPMPSIPMPELPTLNGSYGIIVTGVGGTGVVTVGAVLGMAAHLEGKGSAIIDMAGLAQKGGEVASHLRIAPTPADIKSIRIAASGADLVLGCDMVTASTQKVLASIQPGRTQVIINAHEKLSGEFTSNVNFAFPVQRIIKVLTEAAGEDMTRVVEAEDLAVALFGDAIASNMFMLGYAFQTGAIPVGHEALMKAIEMNGVAVPFNQAAFEWGRIAAHDLSLLPEMKADGEALLDHRVLSETSGQMIERRIERLTDYQNARYAKRFSARMERIQALGNDDLTKAVAQYLYKLMAIKDEYEVARLFSNGVFQTQLESRFDSWDKVEYHLAPPLFSKRNENGELIKKAYGPWMATAYTWLAKARFLRGTPLNVFGYTAERKMEQELLSDYEAVLDTIETDYNAERAEAAVKLASYPDLIRGFGHVKEANVEIAQAAKMERLAGFKNAEKVEWVEAAE